MTLSNIERNYGCYPEYVRQMEEDAAYQYEKEERQHNYYKVNKEKLNEAEKEGQRIDFTSFECKGCAHFEHIGMTGPEDDWDHNRCKNTSCSIFKEHGLK